MRVGPGSVGVSVGVVSISVVSIVIWETIVSVDMRVGPGSVGVSVGVVSISVVSSIVQPWVSFGISNGLGFSLSLGFSLLNRHGRFPKLTHGCTMEDTTDM